MSPDAAPLGVAMIGCGAIAESHLHAIARVPSVRCVALYDVAPGRADALRKRCAPDARVAQTLAAAAEGAALAIVAVPNRFHAETTIALLEAGLHVLCEKPLAVDAVDGARMVETADRVGRLLACGLIRRFYPSTALAREALGRQLVGTPVRCSVRETAWRWPYTRAAFDRDVSGGGVLIDLGPHLLDLAAHLLGPLDLVEYRDDSRGGVEADAIVEATARSASGPIPARFHFTRGTRSPRRLEIVCTAGTITIDSDRPDAITLGLSTPGSRPFTTTACAPAADAFAAQIADLADAVTHGRAPAVPAAETLPTTRLIDACYARRKPIVEGWTQPAATRKAARRGAGKVLVTGATGMVGSRLVEIWAERGDLAQVRCLIRSYQSAARALRHPVDVVEGDLLDKAALARALEGCCAVVHLGVGGRAGAETATIAEMARRAGVRRFVHMSSAAIYGMELPRRIEEQQEDTPLRPTGQPYGDGKLTAEKAVLRACQRGLDAVILRPSIVYGPAMRWTAELAELLASGEIAVLENGGICSLIYVDDLVAAVDRALEAEGVRGRAYFVTDGAPRPWSEYIRAYGRLVGVEPPVVPARSVPEPARGISGWVRESVAALGPVLRSNELRRAIKTSPLLRSTVLRAYGALRDSGMAEPLLARLRPSDARGATLNGPQPHPLWLALQRSEARLSGARAEAELGFRATVDFEDGIRRSADWLSHHGLLPAARAELRRASTPEPVSERAAS